jgi:2-desacetyl-2-hydroxyethyl bacteriochlorophyllide A dehydrogenase
MQALVYHGKHSLAIEDQPPPQPGEDEILVRVTACGICGSDLHGFLGHSARRDASVPLTMGHEFAGQIVELGAGIHGQKQSLAVGDRIVVQPQIYCGHCPACRSGRQNICPNMDIVGIERPGAFAELVAVPAHRAFLLPEGLSELDASLVETLAVEVHLFRKMAAPLPRTVAILGGGAQGLLALQLARLSGAEKVLVSDVVPQRLALAERMGATAVLPADQVDVVKAILDATHGWGAELIVDTAGVPITRQQGVAALAPGGTLALIGLGIGETTLNFLPVVGKELDIRGSYCYSDDDFQRALELIAAGQVTVGDMIDVAPLNEGASLFQRLLDEPGSLTKVLLQPG